MATNDHLCIGRIIGAHGIAGNVKICSYAESSSIFKPGTIVLARNRKGEQKPYSIESVKPHAKTILLSLKEIESRTQAEALAGSDLYIDKRSLPELKNGDYYWFDIIGLSVFTVAGKYIGRVASIMPTGSNDVYIVRDAQKETLVPALASVVVCIDLGQKTMQVDLPDGLR